MPQIRLIALDMDGTLLGSSRQLSRENAEALLKAAEAGITVCLASGRAPITMTPFMERIGLGGPVVSCNGAYVMDRDGNEIHHLGLPEEGKRILLEMAEAEGIHTNLYSRSKVYFSGQGDFAKTYIERTGMANPTWSSHPEMRGLDATKVLFMDTPERIASFNERLTETLSAETANIIFSEADYVEFLCPGVHKGHGVATLAAHLGIDAEETAALGDYLNDLEMIQWAGYGCAVGNAHEEAKAAAREVYPSHDDHAAAVFINHILDTNRTGAIR